MDTVRNPPQPDPWAGWFSGDEESRRIPVLVSPAPQLVFPRDRSLQTEHDLLGVVLDTTGALVVVLDREGRIVRFNHSCEQTTGYNIAEVRGRPLWDLLLCPEEADAARERLERLRAGEFPATHESHWITKDGQRRWLAWSNTTVHDSHGQVEFVIETGIDLTEREQVREALAWEMSVNSAIAELSSALISLAAVDEISALVLDHAKRLTGSAYGFAGYIEPTTGAFVSSTMTRDIWDVCQVADKNVVFHEFKGLWGWVLRHRQPLLANAPAQDPRSEGVPAGHIPIQRFLAAPALLGDALVGMVALANPGRDYTNRELELLQRLAQLYALAIQRQRAEDALRQHAAELQAQNAELDSFAHTVAHDLKGPLTMVLGYAQILTLQYENLSREELQQAAGAILRTGRRMNSIIKELLLLASMRQGEVAAGALDMSRIVSSAMERLANDIEELHPEICLPPAWPAAWGYAPWVEEVWANYLSNALKYGGTPPRLEFGAAEQGDDRVRFWLRDNGRGLTAAEQAHLFTPFVRLQPARAQGHGLGLSIVRHIVERLGGQVGVESESGRGSTFYFTLPVRSSQAAPPESSLGTKHPPRS